MVGVVNGCPVFSVTRQQRGGNGETQFPKDFCHGPHFIGDARKTMNEQCPALRATETKGALRSSGKENWGVMAVSMGRN